MHGVRLLEVAVPKLVPKLVSTTRVLLIEDNAGDARLIRELLAEAGPGAFDLDHADSLSAGVDRLRGPGVDVVLLDLARPDSTGQETFRSVHAAARNLPVGVLSGLSDEALAAEAVHKGAGRGTGSCGEPNPSGF
jgi:CheY-like chemotaxis protein